MSVEITKAGIISCSGEAIPKGTIARLAPRHVLKSLRPGITVTFCLPLFFAEEEGERNFAKTHPTIATDRCANQCAKWGTQKHNGAVSGVLVVSEILGTTAAGCSRSSRCASQVDRNAVLAIAERIAAEVDKVLTGAAPAAVL